MNEPAMASPSDKAAAGALIPQFQLSRVLNQDQAGRRISLLGSIQALPAVLILERSALPSELSTLAPLPASLQHVANLGHNSIYAWYLASSPPSPLSPDLKLNLIYPCTPAHVSKYSAQPVRNVTETPAIYRSLVRPYIERQRSAGRLEWVYNILDGKTEVEDVLLRHGMDGEGSNAEKGFLVLPDLNWDRKTLSNLHLLGLVARRDLWSLRDLKKEHVPWLEHIRDKLLDRVVGLYGRQEDGLERDMVKLYVHYQPTYYHFHIHIVHVALEAGATQAVGKAFGLENVMEMLKAGGDNGEGMAGINLTYTLGEASDLWKDVFLPLKEGRLRDGQ